MYGKRKICGLTILLKSYIQHKREYPAFCVIWVKMNALNKFWKILENSLPFTDKVFTDKVREPERNDMCFLKILHKVSLQL